MAIFTGTAGADNFIGTAATSDQFYFNVASLSQADWIFGGGSQVTDPNDKFYWSGTADLSFGFLDYQIIGTGTIDWYSHVMGIEQLYLSATGTNVFLSSVSMNSSTSGNFEVFGTANGNDQIYANDSYVLRTTNLKVHAGDGNDSITNIRNQSSSVLLADDIYGEGGDDSLTGYGSLYGGAGNDSFDVMGSNSRAYGGIGNDVFVVNEGYSINGPVTFDNIILDGGEGSDYVTITSHLPQNYTFTNIESYYLKGFGGDINQFNSLKQYNSVMWTYSTTSFSITGPGATFDLRTIANGTFDTSVTVYQNYFNPTIENYTIVGTSGHNTITGGKGNDNITGGGLSDTLDGGDSGADILYGGDGDDKLIIGNGGDLLYGGAGNDSFQGPLYYDGVKSYCSLFGGDGNDSFALGNSFQNVGHTIDGGAGFDQITFFDPVPGTNDLSGYIITGVESIYSAGTLSAKISQINSFSYLYLANSALGMFGDGTLDISTKLIQPNKNMYIGLVATGNLTFTSSTGNDYITSSHSVSSGDSIIYGGDGNDNIITMVLSGSTSQDIIYGGNGDDSFDVATREFFATPSPFNTVVTMYGGAGNDTFNYYTAGIFDGGSGIDTITIGGRFSGQNISNIETLNFGLTAPLGSNGPTCEISAIAKFQNITKSLNPGTDLSTYKTYLTLTGDGSVDFTGKLRGFGLSLSFTDQTHGVIATATDYNDTMVGTKFDDTLSGGAGNDILFSGLGHDIIFGGAGNDAIVGDLGNDILIGGTGDDYIQTSMDPANYFFSYVGGSNYVDGGEGNDEIQANGLYDAAVGGNGNDIIYSNTANAVYLYGQNGNDTLGGSDGNDYLDGGAGSDILVGNWGYDYFVGGSGADYFVMNFDVLAGQADSITDFTAGQDFIGLSTIMKNKTVIFDTAYGVDIFYQDSSGGYYQILVTNTHNVAQVTAGVYYYDV